MDPVEIGTTSYGRHWLDRPAAESWLRMVRDGCPAGGITDAGRTHAEQVAVFLKHFTTDYASSAKVDRRVWEGRTYWRRPGKPSAATPGSVQARHTFGRALDLNGATKAWVRANGHRYGWIKDLVRGEDWHMEYQPHRDVVAVSIPGATVPTVPTVPTIPELDPIAPLLPDLEDDTMLIVSAGEAGSYLLSGGRLLGLDADAVTQLRAADIKVVSITPERYLQWLASSAPAVVVASPLGAHSVIVAGRASGLHSMDEVAALRSRGVPVLPLPQDAYNRAVAG